MLVGVTNGCPRHCGDTLCQPRCRRCTQSCTALKRSMRLEWRTRAQLWGHVGIGHIHPLGVKRLPCAGDADHLRTVQGAQLTFILAALAFKTWLVDAPHTGRYATCRWRLVEVTNRAGGSRSDCNAADEKGRSLSGLIAHPCGRCDY